MYATARLMFDRNPNALTIPVQALRREGEKALVYRVNRDNTIDECPVQLGIEGSDRVEIKSGLNENDLVVVGAHSELKPGEKVRIKVESQAPEEGRS
jgi:multidrug efflux pump subunit AcrA (membrane-fusion protein)